MAKVSGVPVENISSLSGVDVSSTSKLMGVPTANIPGWPGGSGPSCTTALYSYHCCDAGLACSIGRFAPYEYDSSTGMLYFEGQCGILPVDIGFYSDYATNSVSYFDGSTLNFIGPCKKK